MKNSNGVKQIICIGSACKDIFFPTGDGKILETPEDLTSKCQITFELGAKYKIEERFETLGGCSANVAVGLARLGIGIACYAHIGDDYSSQWIKDFLEKNEVDTRLMTNEKNSPSDLSAIVVDKKTGERVIFSNQKANGKMEIVPEKIKDAEGYFIGDLHGNWEAKLDIISNVAKNNDIRIFYNPRQANIHDNTKKIIEKINGSEIVFLNKDESIEIILSFGNNPEKKDLDNEIFLLGELKKLGAKIVAITDGKRGSWASEGESVFFAEGQSVPAVDSTGAGDAFSSGFIGAYLNGKNLGGCLQWGIANSSKVVQFYGGIEGLMDKNNIADYASKIKVEKLK